MIILYLFHSLLRGIQEWIAITWPITIAKHHHLCVHQLRLLITARQGDRSCSSGHHVERELPLVLRPRADSAGLQSSPQARDNRSRF